jgi:acyl-CoA thioester hydrolase
VVFPVHGAEPAHSLAVYGHRPAYADGATTYARGSRVLARLDPATMRSAPWSEEFRTVGRGLPHSAQ